MEAQGSNDMNDINNDVEDQDCYIVPTQPVRASTPSTPSTPISKENVNTNASPSVSDIPTVPPSSEVMNAYTPDESYVKEHAMFSDFECTKHTYKDMGKGINEGCRPCFLYKQKSITEVAKSLDRMKTILAMERKDVSFHDDSNRMQMETVYSSLMSHGTAFHYACVKTAQFFEKDRCEWEQRAIEEDIKRQKEDLDKLKQQQQETELKLQEYLNMVTSLQQKLVLSKQDVINKETSMKDSETKKRKYGFTILMLKNKILKTQY